MTDIQPTAERTSDVRTRARRRLAPATFAQQLELIAQRCGAEVVVLPGGCLTLTGTPAAVGQLLAALQGTGRLVSSTTPAPFGTGGQVLVNVRLAPRMQAHAVRQAAPRRKLSRRAIGFIAAGVVAVLAGLGWLVYAVVTAVMANLAVVLLIAGFVVVVSVMVAKAASGGGGKTFSGTFQGKVD